MLIFLLFAGQISEGGQNASGEGGSTLSVEESQKGEKIHIKGNITFPIYLSALYGGK